MRTDKRVTAVITRGNKILLIHRFKNGSEYWVFPGGGVEEGEDLDTGLKREVMEETGLKLYSYSYLFDQPAEDGNTCFFYRCELEPGEPTLGGPELKEQSPNNQHLLEWVEIELLPGLTMFPKQNKLVEILDEGDLWRRQRSKP